MRASIFCGKFLWLHRARDAADQQALRLPGLEQFERAVDAAGTAGQHDDRVGRLRRRRHRRQQREPGETEHPGQEEERDKALYHNIFLSAASKVCRPVKAARAIANRGSDSKSAKPPGPSDAVEETGKGEVRENEGK